MINATMMTLLHVIVPAAQIGLMYLGAGALLWVVLLVIALVMR